MSWLPAIRIAGSRWWLPLSRPAVDLIAAALVEPQMPGNAWQQAFAEQLRVDPPLAIFAVFTYEPRTAEELSIDDLASGLLAKLGDRFASGDAFLGVPEDRDCYVTKWNELYESFIRLPLSKWSIAAELWLKLTGPAVPKVIIDSLPKIKDEVNPIIVRGSDTSRYMGSKLNLSLMARRLRRAQTLTTSFGDAIQEAKRASLKQFAYGLSHEINNPLANISARAQGLMRDEADSARKTSLQRIIDQSMRAHEMIADLMFYAHPPDPCRADVDLRLVLTTVAKQTEESIQGRGIELIVRNPKLEVKSQSDLAMMTEAVRSLVRNSIEAIGCDGRVELSCSIDDRQKNPVVVIKISDSGPGLSDEARKHAFDPYFSGREAGRGLGVGLCRVQRIATLHHGGVSLISGTAGCTARLWIPASA